MPDQGCYTRRRFLRTAVTGALGVAAFPHLLRAQAGAGKRPNIIFLLADDQRADTLGCMGNPVIQTPNLDALAGDGVLFRNAFVTTSICCTSRASILSGQYASRHGIESFSKSFRGEALRQTYPALFHAAGYRTGFIGKYGVGNTPKEMLDFDRTFAGQGTYMHKHSGKDVHLTELMGLQADEFFEGADADRPFCLSVSFKAPHVQNTNEFLPDPKYQDLYSDVQFNRPPTAGTYEEKFPDAFRENNEGRNRWEVRFGTDAKFRDSVRKYYRLITGIDAAVGHIRTTLERRGLADNTIIVYSSDNGFYLSEYGLAGKWWGHDVSARVPLIVYDPRKPATQRGLQRNELALNIDIAPTLLSQAGIEIPARMQGVDLSPLCTSGTTPEWRHDFFYENHFEPGKVRIPKTEGVRSQRFKYLRYPGLDPLFEELYDLHVDPTEANNLANDERYAHIIEKGRARWKMSFPR